MNTPTPRLMFAGMATRIAQFLGRPAQGRGKQAWLVGSLLAAVSAGHGQTVTNTFSGTATNAAGTAWLTPANWSDAAVPPETNVASFGANTGYGTSVGIDMLANGRTQYVGAVEVTPARVGVNIAIGNSSGVTNGRLILNGAVVEGVPNTVLRNAGGGGTLLTLQNNQFTNTSKALAISFETGTNSAVVDTPGTNNSIFVSSVITNTSGGFTKTGLGTLILNGPNTYTGRMVISAGTVLVGNVGAAQSGALGAGDIVNNGSLTFNRNSTSFVGNAISGVGVVSNTASFHTLVLSGTNSYTGGSFTYNGATIVAASTNSLPGFDGSLGANKIVLTNGNSYASGLTVRMGSAPTDWTVAAFNVLRSNINFTSAHMNAIGVDYTNTASPFIFDGYVNGERYGIAKTGAGQVVVTNQVAYKGTTLLMGGTLTFQKGQLPGTTNLAGTADIRIGTLEFDMGSGETFVFTNGLRQSSSPFTVSYQQRENGSLTVRSGDVSFIGGNNVGGNLNDANAPTTSTINVFGGSLRFLFGGNLYAGLKQVSTINVTNGTLLVANTNAFGVGGNGAQLFALSTSVGTLNVSGSGLVQVDNPSTNVLGFYLGALTNGARGTINLLAGGVLQSSRDIQGQKPVLGTSTNVFYFDGGTLRAGTNSANFVRGMTTAAISTNGAIIDTTNYNIGIVQNLSHFGAGTDGGIIKRGSGTLKLGGTNTFNGVVDIQEGRLMFANGVAALGAGTNWVRISTNAALETDTSDFLNHPIEVNGGGAEFFTYTSVFPTISGGIIQKPGWVPSGTDTFKFESVGDTTVATLPLTLPDLQITKGKEGVLLLGEPGNSYRRMLIYEGTVRPAVAGALDSDAAVELRDDVLALNLLDLDGYDQTIGGLVGGTLNSNQVTSLATATLTLNPAATVAFAGTISGDLSLVKVNAGTQILSGSNQFLGAITVSNGTLQIDGNTVSSSLATVASGGVLSGTGTVSALQVDGGGTLSPGSPVGTLTVTGAAALGNGALYAWDYNGAPNDKVTANSVSFNTAWSLSVNALAPWSDGVYTLFSTSGGVSGFVTPTITGISGATGVVSVAGNDVVLTISGSVGLTPFQTWQTNYFGPGGTSDPRAAFGADPDGDGANNLLEYAFGSVPTSGSSLILPESGTSGSFLTITVPRNVDATDITYLVQGGTDLLTWATLDTLTATSPAPGGTTVTYTNATAFDAVPAQFLRVKVTQP